VDHSESAAFVVVHQVLYVLQDKGVRLVMPNDAGHLVKQGSLSLAGETMGPPERVLLRDAGYRERLAREPRQQDIVAWDAFGREVPNIPGNLVAVAGKISSVGQGRVAVPFAGNNASSANGFKTPPEPADAREKIDKSKRRGFNACILPKDREFREPALGHFTPFWQIPGAGTMLEWNVSGTEGSTLLPPEMAFAIIEWYDTENR
jgi:hypothetical protein